MYVPYILYVLYVLYCTSVLTYFVVYRLISVLGSPSKSSVCSLLGFPFSSMVHIVAHLELFCLTYVLNKYISYRIVSYRTSTFSGQTDTSTLWLKAERYIPQPAQTHDRSHDRLSASQLICLQLMSQPAASNLLVQPKQGSKRFLKRLRVLVCAITLCPFHQRLLKN